jgi:hypothetical protein
MSGEKFAAEFCSDFVRWRKKVNRLFRGIDRLPPDPVAFKKGVIRTLQLQVRATDEILDRLDAMEPLAIEQGDKALAYFRAVLGAKRKDFENSRLVAEDISLASEAAYKRSLRRVARTIRRATNTKLGQVGLTILPPDSPEIDQVMRKTKSCASL